MKRFKDQALDGVVVVDFYSLRTSRTRGNNQSGRPGHQAKANSSARAPSRQAARLWHRDPGLGQNAAEFDLRLNDGIFWCETVVAESILRGYVRVSAFFFFLNKWQYRSNKNF